ncbi:MAG: AMP-binding protein [Actinomycetota bacterium]
MNLAKLLADTASRSPDAVAVTFDGMQITYGELSRLADRTAAMLSGAGVQRGDRVAIWLPNHPAFATAMYGAWRIGATVVPLHAALTAPEAKHILTDSAAKIVFAGKAQWPHTDTLVGEVPSIEHRIPLDPPLDGDASQPVDVPAIVDVTDDDLALIQYTAGTSGTPKGAMLSHSNLAANIEQMRATPVAIGPDDVVLCVLPLFHIFGLNVLVNMSVASGARIVLSERFDPAAAARAVRDEIVTVIAGAPPVYVSWLSHPEIDDSSFSNVRVAVSGAAPLSKETLAGFRERFDVTIWEGYGLTETSPTLTTTAIGGVAKPGSVGRTVPNVELRLVDEDGDDVDEGDPGEIIVRGPNVFSGYWNKPEETAKVIRDGWFYTGDVAVADDDGDLFIVDRRRDMVIVSGFNVYPREVEDVLRRHPNVGDVAVVGAPDPQTGERVRAIVVADPPGEAAATDDLLEFCRRHLAPYKIPKEIEIVAEIPRNAAGKVLRRELR